MERVEPIRSVKKINDLKKYLLGSGSIRNYALVVLGFNSALRISDILNLTWDDVLILKKISVKHMFMSKKRKQGRIRSFCSTRTRQQPF